MTVAVIGAGATGSSAARFLAKAGHEVHVFEQFEIGHSRGSSHGTSRIIRRSYPDTFYTSLMEEVYPLWRELEDEANEQLYVETGLMVFGKQNSEWLQQNRNSLREANVPYESFGPVEAAKRFGGFHLDPDEEALFQKQAGYLRADAVILANLHIAKRYGAKIFAQHRAEPRQDGSIDGTKYDAIAICAGAWIKSFIQINVEPRLQHFAYFQAPTAKDIPVWIDSSEGHYYGLPDYGRGFKIGRHLYGPLADPESSNQELDKNVLQDLLECARKRLGAAEIGEAFTCLYTVAPKEDFRIGQLNWEVPAYFVSGCSGHGFKFTVWFGKVLQELIEGTKSTQDYPRFAMEKNE